MKKLFLLCSLIAGFGTLSAQQQASAQQDHHQPGMHHHMHETHPEAPKPESVLPTAAERIAQMQNASTQLCDSMIYSYRGNKSTKEEYAYDIHGNRTSRITSNWSNYESGWQFGSKETYEYDSDRKLTLYFYYIWIDNEWTNESKQEYTYDEKGQETGSISYNWRNEA